ncbi:50S ribosomal protein L29 [Buchnera aphidicola (Chaitoregma tattakana)]|uniref:50S ribosomal protein L29 n=1 Tax=Buchnera aphidicola TaxID=9 RepID=UPI0031B80E77
MKKQINSINIHLYEQLMSTLREEFNLKLQLFSGKLKKTHLLKSCRKKISKIKFLMNFNKVKTSD